MYLLRFKLLFGLLFLVFLSWSQTSQTFSGGAVGLIPDNQTWTSFPLNISTLNAGSIDTIWGIERITINITHTWDADLEARLVSPDGTEVLLFSGVGADGDNFTTTAFSNNYSATISSGAAPFTGNFKPMGDMGVINNGQSGIGVWYLKIRDGYAQDEGNLVSWALRFSTNPSIPYPPISSNLPIIKINTGNQAIPDEPKIPVDFMVIDNGVGNRNNSTDTIYSFRGRVGIELRGSSSGSAPKKSYGFETWDLLNNSIDTSLLGMPAQSDWILSASYYDKTLIRNVLSYYLANETGHYAPRTRYCEVFLDGQYQGVYVLMEKIKRDKNRVDISKMTIADTTGDAVTGGYILKMDKFTGSGGAGFYSRYSPSNPTGDTIYIQYDYPSQANIQPQQSDYIQKYVDSFETALFGADFQDPENGFRRYASEKSLMDYLFINEMSKNVDGYRLSTYFYKDKQSKSGKLKLGPVWDYDIAWYNADYCGATDISGWAYNISYICAGAALPAWWERLRQDTLFNQHLYCRWNYLRSNVFSYDSIFGYIDSTASLLDESQQRNFTTWPIIGLGTWPEPTPLPQSYNEETQRLKNWISLRLYWLDGQFDSLAHYTLPVVLGNDTAFCAGNSIRLNAGEEDTYVWSTGDSSSVIYVAQTGNYTVTVYDNFQCSGTDAINLTVHPLPNATIQTISVIDASVQFASADTAGTNSLWYFGNGDSSTAQNPFYNYAPGFGYFLVTHIITDMYGCSSTDTITIFISNVGIKNVSNNTIHVYPNPAKEQLLVSSTEPLDEIKITDVVGNIIIKEQKVTGTSQIIQISQLTSGVYFIEIKSAGKTLTGKFVKE